MSLKKSDGNMYPWVTHTHSHLRGQCPHKCSYCYVQSMAKKYAGRGLTAMLDKYSGDVKLDEQELRVNYGSGRVIFIEHMNDLFANMVSSDFINKILWHAHNYPKNSYVFQTKNPERAANYVGVVSVRPLIRADRDFFGTTIETDRNINPCAPKPYERAWAMAHLRNLYPEMKLFVTVEPVIDFDVDIMLGFMSHINPTFINIGADSKGNGLEEPSGDKLRAFISGVQQMGIEIRQKTNLERLIK